MMLGSLNDILPEPISEENEKIILDLLKRKMTVSLDIAVQILQAMERRFGAEAREVVKTMIQNQEFDQRELFSDPEKDLREFCELVDSSIVGTYHCERVIDEPGKVAYKITRCMYAEIFNELGEPDLGYVMCARDEPWVKSFNPKLGFKRTKELMGGSDMCDNAYYVAE